MVRRAVVLAAGKSTRIATLAHGLPKPLIEINGEAILARNLKWLAQSGIEEAWINLHYRAELIQERIGDGSHFGLRVRYSHEREILGTAGGARRIASEWKETFVLLYGDSLVRTNFNLMEQDHRESGADVTVGLFSRMQHPHTGLAGGTVTIGPDGSITSFKEGPDAESSSSSSLVNAGLYLLGPKVIERIPPAPFYDFGRDLFPQLLTTGAPINSHLIDGYCLGIDTPEAYGRALRLIEEGSVKLI
jgi:mannose-1-phosphate guanylyltransferase